jgi:hypothetical protein
MIAASLLKSRGYHNLVEVRGGFNAIKNTDVKVTDYVCLRPSRSSTDPPITKPMLEAIKQPWPWYVAGALIGLTVPYLLLVGNKTFGISSSLRHLCAACIPGDVKFFKYDWKKEVWNLFFVGGITVGAFIAGHAPQQP